MAGPKKVDPKLMIGIIISLICIFLAFRKVDLGEMWTALKTANYWYLIPAMVVVFVSHWLRAWRWRFLLNPIQPVHKGTLFSALVIGYAANTFMPAHLGEFLRAYVVSRKKKLDMSPVFATIVVERVVDIFSLLALMLIALFVYPFPDWAIDSGYIMLAGSVGLLAFLFFLKKATRATLSLLGFLLKPFPEKFKQKVQNLLENFVAGLSPLDRKRDYFYSTILSFGIWACYGLVFYFCLEAFNFVKIYNLGWETSLILLVITTIAVVVPSSPGYVGTYHYLCQITLAMFSVPAGPALSYAAVVHGLNFLPVLLVGLYFGQREGSAIFRMSGNVSEIEVETGYGRT